MTNKSKPVATNILITDAGVIGQRLGAFRTAYTRSHVMAQQLAVSSLVHAASSGDPVHLNTFFGILKTNDRDAFRNFCRRIFACIGGWDGTTTVTQDQMNDYKAAGEFLKITNGQFRVLRNDEAEHVKAAKTAMIALADTLLNPDGKVWKPFLDRNNFAETKTFGPEDLRRGIQSLINKASGDRKNVDSGIPEDMLASLVAFQKTIGEPEQVSKSLLN